MTELYFQVLKQSCSPDPAFSTSMEGVSLGSAEPERREVMRLGVCELSTRVVAGSEQWKSFVSKVRRAEPEYPCYVPELE